MRVWRAIEGTADAFLYYVAFPDRVPLSTGQLVALFFVTFGFACWMGC